MNGNNVKREIKQLLPKTTSSYFNKYVRNATDESSDHDLLNVKFLENNILNCLNTRLGKKRKNDSFKKKSGLSVNKQQNGPNKNNKVLDVENIIYLYYKQYKPMNAISDSFMSEVKDLKFKRKFSNLFGTVSPRYESIGGILFKEPVNYWFDDFGNLFEEYGWHRNRSNSDNQKPIKYQL